MIFPIADDNTDRTTTPVLNYLFIAVNVLVFVFLQGLGTNEQFTYAFSTVPQEIVTGRDVDRPVMVETALGQEAAINLQPTPGSVYLTLLTSMFMHASIMHILGNMVFLWVFGDNIEHRLGHVRYLLFYLLCGLAASLSHVLMNADSYVPSLGASGAISGVLGGYVLLFPRRRVTVILLRIITEVPAYVAVGIWFAFQLLEGYLNRGAKGGGVAYAAHIGGFIAGFVLIKLFAAGRPESGPMVRHR